MRGYKFQQKHLFILLPVLIVLGALVYFFTRADISYSIKGEDERWFVGKINDQRGTVGAGTLIRSGCLTAIARDHSVAMARDAKLYHNTELTADFKSYCGTGFGIGGENVGVGVTRESLWTAFMGSTTHKLNIEKKSFTHVGVGVVTSGGELWVTQVFVRCVGTCLDDKDWNSVPNDPPEPSKVSPGADLGACTRTLQFKVKASDTAHKVQTAAEYWVKAPGETDFTNKGFAFFGNSSWTPSVASNVESTSNSITIPPNDNLLGVEYKWRVKARDEKGLESGLTEFSTFKVLPDSENPTTPGEFSSPLQTPNSVRLTWLPSTDNCGLSKYVLKRVKLFPPPALLPDPNSEIEIDLTATATSYTDTAVQSGSYYEYTLKAVDIHKRTGTQTPAVRVFVPLI